jgi:phosphoribosylanthranilate isomerase
VTDSVTTTRIKVTGLTNAHDAELAVDAGVDCAGLVFWADSPRYVTLEQAAAVRAALPAHVHPIGVFVDTPAPVIRLVMEHCGLEWAQLFGRETRDAVEAIRGAFKAVTVESEEAVEAARGIVPRRAVRSDQPAFLLHLTGAVATAWASARRVTERGFTILAAGGLYPDTVEAAVAATTPWGVDVWDAVEAEPRRLDPARLIEFVAAVRSADRRLGRVPEDV